MDAVKENKKIYFISDIHLLFEEDDAERVKRKKLYLFFEKLKKKDILVIAGDLFDFWFEWYHVIPKYWFEVFHRFKNMIDSGIIIHFITGNHDFTFGDYLTDSIGIKCHNESMELKEDEKTFYIAHGDGLAKKDRGYRFLKRVMRNRLSKFLFKIFVHPDLGIQISKWASHSSRKMVKIDKIAWSEEYFEYAKTKFDESFNYVVMGHLHTPMRRVTDDGRIYLNTGDWMHHFSYGVFDGKDLKLEFFK